jgi:hypothetical protein
MIYYYGKVNSKVLDFMNVEKESLYQYADGGYLILQTTMRNLATRLKIQMNGNWLDLYQRTMAQVGGLVLTQQESKDEQDGKVSHPMPQAIDQRFRVEVEKTSATESEDDIPTTDEGEEQSSDNITEETEVGNEQSVSE